MNEVGGAEVEINNAPVPDQIKKPDLIPAVAKADNGLMGRIRNGLNRVGVAISKNSEYQEYDPSNPPPKGKAF